MNEPPMIRYTYHPNPVVIALLAALGLVVLGLLAGAIWLYRTRDKGSHSAGRERPRLRAAAGWVALAATWAIDGTGNALAWSLEPVTWARHAIRKRIARQPAPAPEPITDAHMDALHQLDHGRPWGDDTGSFTKFIAEGE